MKIINLNNLTLSVKQSVNKYTYKISKIIKIFITLQWDNWTKTKLKHRQKARARQISRYASE